MAAKLPGDGYHLFMGGAHHMVAPSMYPRLDYDIEKDFVPLIQVANVPQVLVVNPKRVPQATAKELIEHHAQEPGQDELRLGRRRLGAPPGGRAVQDQTRTFITHIPYRSAGRRCRTGHRRHGGHGLRRPGFVDGHIAGGRIKALMVAGDKRNPAIPDVPSAAEVGYPTTR